MKNTRTRQTSLILVGSISALAILPALSMADVSVTTSVTGSANDVVGGGGTYAGKLTFGGSSQTIIVNSGTVQDIGTGGGRRFDMLGTSNTFTFTGSSTQMIVHGAQNWSNGSTKLSGTGNTLNLLAGAILTANGWNGFDGSSNTINIDGAGSKADWSADNNDGFGNTSGSDVYASNRLNITNGGSMYVSGNGMDNMTANTAGQYTVSVNGAGGRSVLGVRLIQYNGGSGGGIAHIFNGGALETHEGASTWDGDAGSRHWDKIFIESGVLSYKDASAVQMNESTAGNASAFTYAGNNAMRLNNSASTDTGSYTLANNLGTKNYVRLEMINGTTSVARAITIDGGNGGSMLFDGTTATITNGVTLTGAATMTATGTASSLTGVIGSSGSLTKTGTGTLTLNSANTYTGTTTVSAGTLQAGIVSVAGVSGAFGLDSAVTLANTAGVFLDITGFNTQIGTLAGGGATGGTVTLGAATLTVNEATATSYSGAIMGTGGTAGTLFKKGVGTLSLDGVQTYGTLTTDAGKTIVNSAVGTGGSTVNVNAGAAMKFGTVSQTLSSLTIGAGATVTFTSGVASFSGGGKAPSFGGSTVVPETGSMGLLLIGALGVLHRRRRS